MLSTKLVEQLARPTEAPIRHRRSSDWNGSAITLIGTREQREPVQHGGMPYGVGIPQDDQAGEHQRVTSARNEGLEGRGARDEARALLWTLRDLAEHNGVESPVVEDDVEERDVREDQRVFAQPVAAEAPAQHCYEHDTEHHAQGRSDELDERVRGDPTREVGDSAGCRARAGADDAASASSTRAIM